MTAERREWATLITLLHPEHMRFLTAMALAVAAPLRGASAALSSPDVASPRRCSRALPRHRAVTLRPGNTFEKVSKEYSLEKRFVLARRLKFTPALVLSVLLATSAIATPKRGETAPVPSDDIAVDKQYRFDIETTSLASGLSRIGKTSGWRIAHTFDLPGLKETVKVEGSLTVPEALSQLLKGTDISYRVTAAQSVVLVAPAMTAQPDDGSVSLPPMVVKGEGGVPNATIGNLPPVHAGEMVARGGRVGILGNKNIMDTPFNITSYTNQTIESQQAMTIADVVGKDPSVQVSSSSSGMLDAYLIRGFPINTGNFGEIAFDGVYGVAPSYRILSDVAERIEVVKGPTALLYGMAPNSGVGGTINVVPKRARDESLTEARVRYGDGKQVGVHGDVSRRLGPDGEFGVRLNTGYSDGDTAIDKQTRTKHLGSAAVDYKGDRFRATLDLIYQRDDFDAPSREIRLAPGVSMPSAPNGARSVTQSWEWSEIRDRAGLVRAELDVTDDIMLFGSFGGGTTEVDRLFGYPVIQNAEGDTDDTPSRWVIETQRLTADLGGRAHFETGLVDHDLALQASIYDDELRNGSNSGSSVTSNIYNPISRPAQSIAVPDNVVVRSKTQMTGIALTETLSAWEGRVQLTLGGRHQYVETDNFDSGGVASDAYSDNVFSPMVGVVAKPGENTSVYANYIEGLSKGDIAPDTADNAGEALEPYVAKQYEAGVKVDSGSVTATASAFQITKPFGQLNDSNLYRRDGEQRNRGVELGLFGEVTPDIRLITGITWIDAEMTSTNSADTLGKTPIGVPDFRANLTTEWDTPFLPALTLAATITHTGKQYVDEENSNSIPDTTTLDIGAAYETEVMGNLVTVRGSVRNVTDQEYWSGVNQWSMVSQGAPRTFFLSVSSEF